VLRLEWSQVDLAHRAAWIHADQAKARSAISVPLSAEAVEVVRAQIGKHQTRVFVDGQGRPIDAWPTRAQKAWRPPAPRSVSPGSGSTIYGTRGPRGTRSAVRRSLRLQALGGWKTAAMVRRYAHLAIDHLRPYAEAQFGHSAERKGEDENRISV